MSNIILIRVCSAMEPGYVTLELRYKQRKHTLELNSIFSEKVCPIHKIFILKKSLFQSNVIGNELAIKENPSIS